MQIPSHFFNRNLPLSLILWIQISLQFGVIALLAVISVILQIYVPLVSLNTMIPANKTVQIGVQTLIQFVQIQLILVYQIHYTIFQKHFRVQLFRQEPTIYLWPISLAIMYQYSMFLKTLWIMSKSGLVV